MSSRYSSYSCFDSRLWDSYTLSQYALVVIMVAVYLSTLIALGIVRGKTGPGKQLIGLPYMFALFFMFIQQVVNFVSSTLQACQLGSQSGHLDNMYIATTVFYGIQTFLFLFVVIYTLNTMLRKQLGHNPTSLKVVLLVILFVLGSILLSYIVLNSYIQWWFSREYNSRDYSNIPDTELMATNYLGLAFDCVFLISIIGSGALSLVAANSLKRKHVAGSSLMIWIGVLILSLVVYNLISIITTALSLTSFYGLTQSRAGSSVAYWLQSICRALAYITVIVIARNPGWSSTTFAAAGDAVEQPYVYDYPQQQPMYNGVGHHA